MVEAARNLRSAERYLLAPPLAARFGAAEVAVCDISVKGARFRHARPLETGSKALLRMSVDGRPAPVSLEATIVWTQADSQQAERFVSGVRTYGDAELMGSILTHLQQSKRTTRIDESRAADRFFVAPPLEATYGGDAVAIEDLSAHGARIATRERLTAGTMQLLRFALPELAIDLAGTVRWTGVKAVGDAVWRFHAGLHIAEKPELLRLALGHLCEQNRASLDTQSLRLKLKIIRARARQLAPSYPQIEAAGIPAEQYLLIQGVREELRLNPDEAMHWYRRARISINDPAVRSAAPAIASHPDALAVWEYLDRSVDPTIVGRAFELA
jgi:PilZ domain